MNAETIRGLLAKKPFVPFQINLASGESFQVRHPEMAWVIGGRVYIHQPEKDYEVMCSLLHITTVHPLETATL